MSEKGTLKDYQKQYEEIKFIGRGSFGSVLLVRNREDKTYYVAKKIPLDALAEKEIEMAFGEVYKNKLINMFKIGKIIKEFGISKYCFL